MVDAHFARHGKAALNARKCCKVFVGKTAWAARHIGHENAVTAQRAVTVGDKGRHQRIVICAAIAAETFKDREIKNRARPDQMAAHETDI